MAQISPTVAQWELNLRLRKRRKDLGMDVKTITDAMGFTRNYWSIVENDRRILTEVHLRKIVELFEFEKDEQRELLDLRAAAKGRGWWDRYSALLDDSVVRLFGMEYGAHAIRAYEGGVMTGLLQTEDYTRAVLSASIFIREADIEQRLDMRMRRQQRLFEDDSQQLTVILGEGVLQQQLGGRRVQHGQLLHLAKVIEEHPDNIDVRVLPFTATGRGIVGASTFYLFDFPSSHLPTSAWYECVTFWGFVDDADQVRDLNIIYMQAHDEALSREDSLIFIKRSADELK